MLSLGNACHWTQISLLLTSIKVAPATEWQVMAPGVVSDVVHTTCSFEPFLGYH